MVEMSTGMNERVLVKPASSLLCSILAVASGVHYMVRDHLWKVAKELPNTEVKCAESDEAKETVQSTFDINQHTLTLYRVAHKVARIYPYDLDPKSHTGAQLAMNTRWFNQKLKVDFDKTMGCILKSAEELLRTNWRRYLHRAKDMKQHYVWHRTELLRLYPHYLNKEGRADNNIPNPEPHTIAVLLVIQDLLSPLNDRGQFAKLIIEGAEEATPDNTAKKDTLSDIAKQGYITSLKKNGWIADGVATTNAATSSIPVAEVDPRTEGNHRPEPHKPHGKVVLPATAA